MKIPEPVRLTVRVGLAGLHAMACEWDRGSDLSLDQWSPEQDGDTEGQAVVCPYGHRVLTKVLMTPRPSYRAYLCHPELTALPSFPFLFLFYFIFKARG